ncbi:hypothetical protein Tsubulata_037383 [Turnera subulata]|uniref:Uncharacterized protein n=1 Tax=Turnera subulata TaxID=218843 RepID=A0A9Q0J234_9ROSI|nr:hypothetical protein Tsubulata_037383 [Turnera subulata]
MELQAQPNPNKNGQNPAPDPNPTDLESPNNGNILDAHESQFFHEDFDSTCSTPYVSAPSSPGRGPGPVNGGFFYSCPASPMHFAITTTMAASSSAYSSPDHVSNGSVPLGYEFEFSARCGSAGSGQPGSMSSADELFLNGQIRPMKLSSHLERPQVLAPLLDLENEEEEDQDEEEGAARFKNGSRMVSCGDGARGRELRLRDKSLRRRTRSMSPFRTTSFEFDVGDDDDVIDNGGSKSNIDGVVLKNGQSCGGGGGGAMMGSSLEESSDGMKICEEEATTSGSTPSVSASSSRSSSAGRNSKRWVFLKDFLYRSKSEGRSNNKFWSNISFSPAKEKSKSLNSTSTSTSSSSSAHVGLPSKDKVNMSSTVESGQKVKGGGSGGQSSGGKSKPMNGVGKRRVPASPHELHYKASRAQAEEMRKKTFLPYRQGLLGCLGFSSKGYGAMNGFARALNPVSSR